MYRISRGSLLTVNRRASRAGIQSRGIPWSAGRRGRDRVVGWRAIRCDDLGSCPRDGLAVEEGQTGGRWHRKSLFFFFLAQNEPPICGTTAGHDERRLGQR